MACACKITKYVNRIEKKYGEKTWQKNKSNITELFKNGFKKTLFALLIVPFLPIMLLYLLIRNCFTQKAISIDKIFKLK